MFLQSCIFLLVQYFLWKSMKQMFTKPWPNANTDTL